jgi:hypothetical protein
MSQHRISLVMQADAADTFEAFHSHTVRMQRESPRPCWSSPKACLIGERRRCTIVISMTAPRR